MRGLDSTLPLVKTEPDFSDLGGMSGYTVNNQQGSWPTSNRPAHENSMSYSNGGNLLRPSFGSQQNLSSSFNDDELADFLDYDQGAGQVQSPTITQYSTSNVDQSAVQHQQNYNGFHPMSAPQRHQGIYSNHDVYSNTPPGNPMQSPFAQSYDRVHLANQARLSQSQQGQAAFHNQHGIMGNSPMGSNGFRSGIGRLGSSPLSPTTAQSLAMANMRLGTPDTSSHGGQSIPNRKPRSSSSSHWENRLGAYSFDSDLAADTPLTSPMSVPPTHQQLASIMENEKSAPARSRSSATQKAQSVPSGVSKEEQKKAKRRFAHNVVEQKRRDKINERIQELSRLVPAHRLEDNKLRKQLATRSTSGAGTSPPSGTGVRKSSSAAASAPPDDRDKTKGNSLDGAVAWTRDLMWMLHRKLEQETILIETIEGLGAQVPFQIREEEQRMRSELMLAIETCGADCLEYSRAHGSGLWVPDHTDQSGNPLAQNAAPDYFVDFQGSETNLEGTEPEQLWQFTPESGGRDSLDPGRDDEFTMDMS